MVKKTAYEKLRPLLNLKTDKAYVRTALRHFSDDDLLREIQKRNARIFKTGKENSLNTFDKLDDEDFFDEFRKRGLHDEPIYLLERAIKIKDWDFVEAAISELEGK